MLLQASSINFAVLAVLSAPEVFRLTLSLMAGKPSCLHDSSYLLGKQDIQRPHVQLDVLQVSIYEALN